FDMIGLEGRDLSPWILKKASKDKIKCNKPNKLIAQNGECAFQFKGGGASGLPEAAKLIQKVNPGTVSLHAGDVLRFSFYYNGKGSALAKAKAVVRYTDPSLPKSKAVIELVSTNGVYQPAEQNLLISNAGIDQIKV